MAFIHSTILLAVLLVGPAAAASPLEPVDVGQIVSELGAYFGELASNALSVESAQNEYTRLTQGQTQFSIDKLISAVALDSLVEDLRNISDSVLQGIQTSSTVQDTGLGECCGSTSSQPCCHRCTDFPALRIEALNAGLSLSQAVGNGTAARATFQFGFSRGPLVQYPPPGGSCSLTDPTLQQWYTFAVSGPRKVVVLLDISFDLVRADRAALRNASINLLRSLNSKDQVSLVVYSAKIQTPPSCYEFISATAENIDYLVKYVTDVEDLKGPAVLSTVLGNATAAFNEADLIMSGQTGTVVVLSGASADFASSVATVTGNPHIQFKFILPQNATPPLPPELSQQNAQSYVLSVNAFAPIASLVEQRNTSASQLEWTTSLDPSTGEKSISFVRPLSTGGTLHGVFHARITVYDLFRAAFRYLDTKPLSYFFVTDSSAERHAIYHPLSQGNTIIQSIFEVERSLRTLVNNTNVITDVSVSSTNVLPLGPSDEEGIQVDTHDYTYSCRVALSINGFSNQLVLCVALRSGANVEVTLRAPAESFDNLAYHTQLPQESACSHLGHQANTDSALRLYGASQPAAGVSDSALHTYLTTGGAVPEDVMQDVRADSNTASVLTRSWATDTLAATWRYFLSDRGLFTVYPGVQLPADYQPAEATWYRSALPHTNVALSPVERDPLGSGFVYGISRRVIASSVPHGVVGAHVSAGSLAAEVKRLAPECEMNENRCYIFDTSGSIIYFRGLRTDPPRSVLSLTEISSRNQYLSHILTEATQFKRREVCIDYSTRSLSDRHFFQYTWPDQEVNNIDMQSTCLHYRIRGIPGTNAIFAISARPGSQQCTPLCPCRNTCPASECPNYAATSTHTCLCRCSCAERKNDVCAKKNQTGPICPPLRETPPKFQPVTVDVTSAACSGALNCSTLESGDTCLSASPCLLCGSTCQGFGSCCNSTYRNGFAVCDDFRTTQPPPDPTDTQPPPAPTSVAAIVVPVVLIVVLIVLILVALMLWYNCRIKGKEEAGTRKHRGAFDFSKDKSLGEEKEAKIAEVTVDSKLDKDKGNLAVAAPVELADSAENGEKPAITDTAI